METQIKTPAPPAQRVLRLSEQLVEPGWLRETRLKALEQFGQTPWPTGKEEIWRKTKIRYFQGNRFPEPENSFGLSAADPIAELPKSLRDSFGTARDFSAILIQETGQPCRRVLNENTIFLFDLPRAARFFPDDLSRFFSEKSRFFSTEKLELLHEAFWNSGVFLKIPSGLFVERPVLNLTQMDAEARSVFPQTILWAQANSSVTFVEIVRSDRNPSLLARNTRVKILAEEGAQVRYFLLNMTTGRDTAYTSLQVVGKRDSSVHVGLFQLGGGVTKTHIHTDLVEPGASTTIQGLYFPDEDQHTEVQTFQNHFENRTDSTLHLKGAVGGRGKAVYRGVIHIHPNAQDTSAYQLNNNLLLSSQAHADSNPVLEIEANEVRCSHGASAGPVDRDQLFYLQSRGLQPEKAKRVIVEGFFNPIIDLLPTEWLRENIRRAVADKIQKEETN